MADKGSGSGYTPTSRKPRYRGNARGRKVDSSEATPTSKSDSSKGTPTMSESTPKGTGDDTTVLSTPTSQPFSSPQGNISSSSPTEFVTPPSSTPPPVVEEGKNEEEAPTAQIPEKPPRKISAEKMEEIPKGSGKKVFEAPKVEDPALVAHKSKTTLPLAIEILDGDNPPPPTASPKGQSSSSSSPRKSSQGFAYGLGGPLGKPAYGIKIPSGEDDEDPEAHNHPRLAARLSIVDISREAKKFSGRQWITLVVFGLADLFSAMAMSLQAPFYPPEAEKKGATATEYGLVFGIYELIVFLMSPLFGKYMNKIGPRLIFNTGILITSISCIAFGLLDNVTDHTLFITLSFLFRTLEALGASAFVTASFTIIACEFPDSVATTFASLETFFGLGLIVGPSVGGALFELGGFFLPFAFTGVGLFLISLGAFFVMPKIETLEDLDGRSTEGFGIFSILRIPGVAVGTVALVMITNSVGFLSATLEPHLRQFNLSPLQVGLMFIIYGGVYAVIAPFMGYICDKIAKPIYLILAGAVLTLIAFILIGPAPFIPMDTILWVTAVGLVIQGLALGFTMVATFISCLRESMKFGFPDNISTYAVVSGLWTSAVSLGAFLGPSIAGLLFDIFGFRSSTYYVFGCQALVILLVISYIIIEPRYPSQGPPGSESAPLLSPIFEEKNKEGNVEGSGPSVGYGAITS